MKLLQVDSEPYCARRNILLTDKQKVEKRSADCEENDFKLTTMEAKTVCQSR